MYEIRHKLSLGRSALGANRENITALSDCPSSLRSSREHPNTSLEDNVLLGPTISMARRELSANIERADNLMQRMDGVLGLASSSKFSLYRDSV